MLPDPPPPAPRPTPATPAGGEAAGVTDAVVHEHMRLQRHAVHGLSALQRPAPLDRSAVILLSRLTDQGPMTMAELAAAFGLDVSTLQRQLSAAERAGLVERVRDPDGGQARRFLVTPVGGQALAEEFAARRTALGRVTADWTTEDLETFTALLRRFNASVEEIRGLLPWPRREESEAGERPR